MPRDTYCLHKYSKFYHSLSVFSRDFSKKYIFMKLECDMLV